MKADYEKEPPSFEQKSLSAREREGYKNSTVSSVFNFVSDFDQVQ